MTDAENHLIDTRTRSNVTYILVVSAVLMLAYIIYRWGQEKEILTLIIGLIGGTILGLPLGAMYTLATNKKQDSPIIQQTGDSPVATTTNEQTI